MGKKLFFFCILLFAAASVLPAANGQRVIPLSSGLYDVVDALFMMEGKAMPSAVRPWTAAEAEKYLSLVSRSAAPGLYDYAASVIGEKAHIPFDDVSGVTLGLVSNVNFYFHTDTSFDFPFDEVDNYFFRMGKKNDESIFRGTIEAYFGENFYLYLSMNYRNADRIGGVAFDSYRFNFDFSMFTPKGFTSEQDLMVPDRAFLSAGGSFWNLQIGRDRFKIGSGKTGNLVLSDNFPFHSLIRLNLFGPRLKFSFAMSSFWPPEVIPNGSADANETEGLFLFVTNRIEGYFFSERLSFAFSNSMMFKSEKGLLNPRYINPVDFFHNYFVDKKQNSSSAFELVWGFARGWNAYAQIILDDLATPSEGGSSSDAPNQVGFLLGLRHAGVLGKGILVLNLESVYTFPYLYLRSTDRQTQAADDKGLSYIGIVRGLKGNLEFRRYFVGYTYGGDAAVIDFRCEYTVPDDLKLQAGLFWMLHGEKNFDSKYTRGDTSCSLSGNISSYACLQMYCRKEITDYLGICGRYDLAYAKGRIDNQFVLGIGISL